MVNMNQIMKQAQNMQKKLAEIQEKIASEEFEAVTGGGAVVVTINGKGELKKIKLEPSVVDKDDIEVLEDLIVAAFNEAKRKAEEASENSMSDMTGGIKFPPGMKFPF